MRCSKAVRKAAGDLYSRGATVALALSSPHGLLQALASEHPSTHSLSNRLFDEIRGDRVHRTVHDGSKRRGHLDWSLPFSLVVGKVVVVEDDVAWDPNATFF